MLRVTPSNDALGRTVLALASDRGSKAPLDVERALAALAARAPRIPFVTLIEHLERLLTGAPPVGTSPLARDEVIRFRHDPSLVFHASDIAKMRVVGKSVDVTSTFLGATGAVSPLASFFTEDVLRSEAQDSATLGAFYDLFHHRLLALCYRALRRSRLAWSIHESGADVLTGRALASAGLWPKREDAALSSVAMLGRARVLARRPRSRQALEAALALAFPSLRVRIVDFFPRRVRLADEQRLRVGRQNHRLGAETRVGRHMTGQSDVVRLEMGPVDRTTFDLLLPGGRENRRLRRVVDDITGGMLDVEVEIEILKGEEPRAALGRRPGATTGARLGRSSLVLLSRSPRSLRVRISLGADAAEARPIFFHG
jgi:type VI secretion system protein ImpH